MSSQTTNERPVWPYVIGILGSLVIVVALSYALYRATVPAPLGQERAQERAKALVELRAAETEALHTTAYLDPAKGIVRLRIDDAMALVQKEWQNPEAGRKDLIAREEKATALPPKAPEKPSQFE